MKAKNLLWLLLIAIVLVILAHLTSGCADDPTVTVANPITTKTRVGYGCTFGNIGEITYDGCQYMFVYWGNATWGAHKGNCTNPIHMYNIEKK